MAFAAFVALLAFTGLLAPRPAAAAKATSCGKQVVSDWYSHADRKVHGTYPLRCYREALDSLDPSVEEYTNAREAISAALAAASLRNPGGPGSPGGPTGKLPPGEKWIEYRNTYDFGGADTPPPIDTIRVSSTSPSSVPVPLIVLAALAGVLLLAGGGGYVARRVKASRTTPPVTDP